MAVGVENVDSSWWEGSEEERYMRMALALAEKGMGFTSPNPMVGAVIVKDGRVIGQGYHERYGQLHAERNALASCTEDPAGSTVYVTLEPCCHHGKTPPCTDALIEARVARVVVGSSDPNPLIAGKGIEILREHGIEVCGNVCEADALELNAPFFHFITTGRPLVVLKYAMTMDGKIACCTGESRWVTGEEARTNVHRDRLRYSSIMVGMGTVAADDPLLTCRLDNARDPLRVVCDSGLSIPMGSRIVQSAGSVRTVIATCSDDPSRASALEQAGCEIWHVGGESGRVDLRALMARLGEAGIDSVYIEGGATLAWSALEAKVVDRVHAYIAPKIFGGSDAPTPVGGRGVAHPADCIELVDTRMRKLGADMLLESEVRYCSRG